MSRNTSDTQNMALFCDFENVALGVRDARYEHFDIRKILERLLLKGSIVVKKAYCDWERYRDFKTSMHQASFEMIEIPHVSMSGKNSADIRMVVDALDLCYTKAHVDTFVIISGDSDFSPLVSKLRENDKTVIGVGVKNSTSDLLIANCDEFIFYDDLVREQRRRSSAVARTRAPARRRSESLERVADRGEKVVERSEKVEKLEGSADAIDLSGAPGAPGAAEQPDADKIDKIDKSGKTARTGRGRRGARGTKGDKDDKDGLTNNGSALAEPDVHDPDSSNSDFLDPASADAATSGSPADAPAYEPLTSEEAMAEPLGLAGNSGQPPSAADREERILHGLELVVETLEALVAERGEDERIWGSMIKQTLKRRNPGFNEVYYGFKSFNRMLEEARDRNLVILEDDDKSGGYVVRPV